MKHPRKKEFEVELGSIHLPLNRRSRERTQLTNLREEKAQVGEHLHKNWYQFRDICKENLNPLPFERLIIEVILSKSLRLQNNMQKCSPKREQFLLRRNGFQNMVLRSWIL